MTGKAEERRRTSARGRPEATSHAHIEQVAFTLFAERGFARTTLDAIAEGVGVGRRTLFRYYRSKNDIPWGQFDRTLDHFRALLAAQPAELSTHEAVHRAVVEFNRFPEDAHPPHRERMRLILTTSGYGRPELVDVGAGHRPVPADLGHDQGGHAGGGPLPRRRCAGADQVGAGVVGADHDQQHEGGGDAGVAHQHGAGGRIPRVLQSWQTRLCAGTPHLSQGNASNRQCRRGRYRVG